MKTVDRFCGELVMLFDHFLDANENDAGQARDAIHAAITQDRAEALLADAPSPEPQPTVIPDRQQMTAAFEDYGRRCNFSVAKGEHGDYVDEQSMVYYRVWKRAWQAFRVLAAIAKQSSRPQAPTKPQPTAEVVAEAVLVGCVEFLRERAKGCDCGEVHEAPDASGLADDLEAMPLAPILKTLGATT